MADSNAVVQAAPGMAIASAVDAPAKPIQVMFCCDENYFQHLAVAITSLLSNNRHHQVAITVVTNHCSEHHKLKLTNSLSQFPNCILHIRSFDMNQYSSFFINDHLNLYTYARIFCADILSDAIDKVLYIDADTVIVEDLSELWQTELKGKAVAAVPEPSRLERIKALGVPSGAMYFNAGVLLINLDYWRRMGVRERLVECILERGSNLTFHDQDALNIVLADAVLYLPDKWNSSAYFHRFFWSRHWRRNQNLRKSARQAVIIHFNSAEKPWIFGCVVPRQKLYFYYLRQTAWRDYSFFQGQWRKVPRHVVALILYGLGVHRQSVDNVIARLAGLIQIGKPSAT